MESTAGLELEELRIAEAIEVWVDSYRNTSLQKNKLDLGLRIFVADDELRVVAVLTRLRRVEWINFWVFLVVVVFAFALALTSAYTTVADASATGVKHPEVPTAPFSSLLRFCNNCRKTRPLRLRTHLALARCQSREILKIKEQPRRMACLDDAQNGVLVFFEIPFLD